MPFFYVFISKINKLVPLTFTGSCLISLCDHPSKIWSLIPIYAAESSPHSYRTINLTPHGLPTDASDHWVYNCAHHLFHSNAVLFIVYSGPCVLSLSFPLRQPIIFHALLIYFKYVLIFLYLYTSSDRNFNYHRNRPPSDPTSTTARVSLSKTQM